VPRDLAQLPATSRWRWTAAEAVPSSGAPFGRMPGAGQPLGVPILLPRKAAVLQASFSGCRNPIVDPVSVDSAISDRQDFCHLRSSTHSLDFSCCGNAGSQSRVALSQGYRYDAYLPWSLDRREIEDGTLRDRMRNRTGPPNDEIVDAL